jgi:hypothetical protein
MDPEFIRASGELLAVVVRHDFAPEKLAFPTPKDFPLQLGIHIRKKGDAVEAHGHVPFVGLDIPAQEFFYVVAGRVEVDVYHTKKKFCTLILNAGDMVLLNCAHGMRFAADSRIVEIKQGPYRGKENEKEFI